ncbi:lysophospholipase [Rhodopirellula sp. SM50]|nr:lysophospholipase [Rhodopirellula sp. SM50]
MTAAANRTLADDRGTSADVPGYGYRLPRLRTGSTLLFQGDSITDMKWGRNQKDRNHYLGHSYVFLIASRLHTDMPNANLNFLNRGMSGHTVADLQKRWQKDAIDLNADVLSVLIGINDVGRAVRGNKDVDPVAYEAGYRDILMRSRTSNPSLRIVLIEPFVLPVTRDWRSQTDRIRPVVAKLAREFEAVLIPTQKIFDEASKRGGPEHWIWDGVHPLPQGHELIARNWIERVAEAWN